MKATGSRTFNAPPHLVWDALTNPALILRSIPGAKSGRVLDGRRCRVIAEIPVALGLVHVVLYLAFVDGRDEESAQLLANCSSSGAVLSIETDFSFDSTDVGGTLTRWTTDISVNGPVGAIAKRVLSSLVNDQISNTLTALERLLLPVGA